MGELQRKRCREEDEIREEEKGMVKRLHGLTAEVNELIHMLEETEEDRNVAEEDVLSDVMKSLEEEINSCCCSEIGNGNGTADVEARCLEGCGYELSNLFTASDDELGIPPSPSAPELPFYERLPESPCHEDGLWHFEEYNPNWVVPLVEEDYAYEEYEESDYGGLFELSEGEQAQKTSWAM